MGTLAGPFSFAKGHTHMSDTTPERPSVPALVVYTKAPDAKSPRAAWYGQSVKETAKLYAQRAGYTAIEIKPDQVDLVKAAVSEGEEPAAGKLTLYAVKRDVLDKMLGVLGGAPADAPDGSGKLPPGVMPKHVGLSDSVPASSLPVDPLWANLAINMVVLAPEYTDQGTPEGWWEAVIVAIHNDVLRLRWRDYPRQEHINRKRDEVALMYPPPARV